MNTSKAHGVLRLASLTAAIAVVTTAFIAPGTAAAQSIHPPTECNAVTGTAGAFACEGVDLLAIVPSFELSFDLCNLLDPTGNPNIPPSLPSGDEYPANLTGSDMWGWITTDNSGNVREFALQGMSDVVAFIEVTDPEYPVFHGCLGSSAPNFLWRDVKVYNDHVYVVGDFSPELETIPVVVEEEAVDHHQASNAPEAFLHGLQIFDLKNLLIADPNDPNFEPQQFIEDNVYEGFDEAHNIVINEQTGFAAAVASDTCGAEFHLLDLSEDPKHPEFLGCFDSGLDGAVHDAQCTTYKGDDFEHFGKEICLAFMEDQFAIMDMSKPSNPEILTANNKYPGLEYVHQGWFSDDYRYVLSNDEQDEMYAAINEDQDLPLIGTRTYVWDAQDLDNPVFKGYFTSPTFAIDHNMYFKGEYLHQANYTSGYRVLKFDPSRIDENPDGEAGLEQVAFFDTVPSGPLEADGPAFGGVWSGYFHFESGAVALSQLNNGELFILKPQDDAINNAGKSDDPEDPNEPVDVIPEEGRVHGSGYLHGMSSNDGDSDSDSDTDSDSDFEKIDFSFDAKVKDGELEGKLKLKDKELGVKIEAKQITSLIPGGVCNGVATSAEGGFVFRAIGEFNGLEGVEFRVCGEDNGKHGKGKDGQPADRFYLECITDCTYNTASRTLDDRLDGGNIHLHDPIIVAEGTMSASTSAGDAGGAPDSADQMVISLDPMLEDSQLIGQPLSLTAVIETADGMAPNGRTLTLHSEHENGAAYATSVVSDALGKAVFTVTPLQGETAYWVSLDGIESNRVTLTGSL